MKIFLPIKIKPTGGSSSFANKLKRGLQSKGHKVSFNYISDFDILLVNAVCPLKYLLLAKLKHKPIILRLDGAYYPTTIAGIKYRLYNLPIQIINLFFSNHTIFQSKYSQKCCYKFIGKNRLIKNSIIYNGIDTDLFSNQGQRKNLRDSKDQHLFITTARFRRADQIKPLIKGFKHYQKSHHQNSKLIVIGNFEGKTKDIPRQFKQDPSIKFLGVINNNHLPQYLSTADVFLFTHINPPCPNNILEAMACGLPICGVDDGAMSELTKKGSNSELIPAIGEAFYRIRPFNHILFSQNLNKIMNNHKHYARSSRIITSHKFTLRRMVDNYLNVITGVS